jgi:hypothetical protein
MFAMGQFIRRHKRLSAVLVVGFVIAGFWGWDLSAQMRGQLIAHFDLSRRHYRILMLGLPTPWRPEYAHILLERYGIENRVVAGCVVTQPLLAYVDGYNQVSMSAANRKFGRDVFKDSIPAAIRNWKARTVAEAGRE